MVVANKIALGHIECGIAGGVDTTSDAPIALNEKMRKILLEVSRAKTAPQRLAALSKMRPAMLVQPALPRNGEPRTGLSMGEHAELMAQEWGITREDQDALALKSHSNLAKAYEKGFFNDLMTPFKGVGRDNNLRVDLTIEKLRGLKPVFDKKVAPEKGTLTAGNSTPLTDGASAVLLASEDWAKAHKIPVLAYLTFSEVAAVDFFDKKEGLLMAPAYAVPRMLARAGLSLQDFDFYEIHEAFAAQVLCTLKAWEDKSFCKEKLGLDKALGKIDRKKLNTHGSSLAAGHPFAATGGRIVATLAKMLAHKGAGRGLISICAAGGQGVVAIVER
ncbi:MAG: acetyl-CoA acetyltransferase [Burkholderiales bacterium PBB4]|nr:MAG: acetyl-CoA acetyltransferase [Burkholderiales bacterium PBB4]